MPRSGPRIVGGSLGGRTVRVPRGARPTEGRVREAVFSIWSGLVPGCRFLDLFAGSGAVGLEAASRGAEAVTWVEGSRRAVGLLERNVNQLRPAVERRILRLRLPRDLERRRDELGGSYDLVYADPPYAFDDHRALLQAVVPSVRPGGELALEHARPTRISAELAESTGWELVDRRTWGDCGVTFLRRPGGRRPEADAGAGKEGFRVRGGELPGGSATVKISADELDPQRLRERYRREAESGDLGPSAARREAARRAVEDGVKDIEEREEERVALEQILVLNKVASALISHVPLAELVEKILRLVIDAVPAERGALLLRRDRGRGELEVRATHGYGDQSEVKISETVIRVALEERHAVLTLDAQSDERFEEAQSIMMQGIRSVVCVPMNDPLGEVIGLIYLDHRFNSEVFSESTLRLVGLIAHQAAMKVDNVWLLEDQYEKRRMEEQLAVAARIQRGLLPESAPRIEGYEIAGTSVPCFEIGGDYYDFLRRADGRLALVVADISGKGIGAALLMAVFQASLRALFHAVDDPAELISRLNQVLVESSPANKFATVFYAELDPEAHTLEYVSGGHNSAFLYAPGEDLGELHSTGPIVGLVEGAEFTAERRDLRPGSTLLVYTDGVTEVGSEDGGELGEERLAHLVAEHGGDGAGELLRAVRREMSGYVDGESFDDDSTLVAVHRSKDRAPPSAV